MCSFVLSRLDYCNSLLIDITSDQMYRLQKIQKSRSQSGFSQKQTWACYTTSQKSSLAPSQSKNTFQDSHLSFSFFWWYPATKSVILSLCVHCISYSPFQLRCPRREAGDVWCLPPVWNLRAAIWFHFAISSLVLLPSPVTLSVLSFSACWPFLLNFFPENSSIFFVKR